MYIWREIIDMKTTMRVYSCDVLRRTETFQDWGDGSVGKVHVFETLVQRKQSQIGPRAHHQPV